MYRPVLVTGPAAMPVSLAEVKAHLRVDDNASDDLITGYIAAAVAHIDGWSGTLGRCLVTQSWRQDFDGFCRELRLPVFPVVSVTSVTYEDDVDGTEQTVAGSNYTLLNDDRGAFVRFKSTYDFAGVWTELPAVHVTYVAGYGAASAVPEAIKQAIKLMVGAWFENREESIIGVPVAGLTESVAVKALLGPYRRMQV